MQTHFKLSVFCAG